MEETMINYETELRNLSDDSESCSSSCCSDSEYERLPWLENVSSNGHLFYVEHDIGLEPFLEDAMNHSYLSCHSWSHIRHPKSKLNAAEKLKRWMKERGKKVRESFPLLKSSRNEANRNSFSHETTLSHYHSKDIFIDIDSKKIAEGSKLSAFEELLGLKLGSLNDSYDDTCDRVFVLGISSHQDVYDIKIGDWLKSVNDIDVHIGNVEDVIKRLSLPSKVKLNILSAMDRANSKSSYPLVRHNSFIKELIGDSSAIQFAKMQYQHVPHGLFHLTIGNSTSENDDVLYHYPEDDVPLFHLKGMFLTLGHMITDVASPPLLSCSVMVHGEIVHVGFVKEDNEIMVLALPASVASVAEIQHFSTGLAKLFKYQFSSLHKAFIAKIDGTNNMNNFLALFFTHYLSSIHYTKSKFSEPHLLDILPSAQWLSLPNDLKTEIDDILSELESSDFEINSKGFYKNRRIYNIFGSCLFYKGYLLSSHLPKDDLLDIHLFLHYHHILELTQIQPVSQIIIWREVFPSRHQVCPSDDPEFQESHGRWFLLTVVMQHCILAVLLDDGGCALEGEDNVPPEPFYVEEVQNTLFILEDCGITAATEKLLNYCAFSEASTDLFENSSSQNSLSSAFASNVSIHSGPNISSTHSASHSSLSADKEGPADGESDTESTYSNNVNENTSSEKRSRSYSVSTGSTTKSHESSEYIQVDRDFEHQLSQRNTSSLPNLSRDISENISLENSFRMISGFGNNIFCYLHMDPVEGIFIAPVISDLASLGSVQRIILDSFHSCCLNMRIVFERSLRNGGIIKANITTKYGINNFLQNAYEQGVLFRYNHTDSTKQKGNNDFLNFWVIGRLFFTPEPREVYVCYQDCTAQDIVEIAFQLGFGLSF